VAGGAQDVYFLLLFRRAAKDWDCRTQGSFDEMLVITNNASMASPGKARRPSLAAPTLEESAYVALQRTADRLQTRMAEWLKPHGLSPTQYNALRILRGAGPEGLPCSQIGERMLTHDSDITRLVDRLEKRGLVARRRDSCDRRVVRARIKPAGLDLLAELDRPLRDFVKELLGPACAEHLRSLLDTCETLTAAHHSQEGGGSG
jgi:DNA-binding MarR family transcriptional regulator